MVSNWSNAPKDTAPLASLLPQRRYLVLNLPRWATDCLKRRDPALLASSRPFALYEKQKSALKLVAVDASVSRINVWPGHNLTDARALIPNLEAREIDRPLVESLFADFADWHSYASPIVAVLPDMSAFGDLALDITGVSHLFGGEEKMLKSVLGRLRELGLEASGAIASSIGAAWALAQHRPGAIIGEDADVVLAELPVSALRLAPEQIATLQQLGLKRIGQLYAYPRKALQARLGASLILRLDQARGLIDESIKPRLPAPERFVERRFAEPISLLDSVMETTRDLAIRLSGLLEAEGMGAQAFHLMVYRVDHKVMCLSVRAARTTRDPAHLARLFANRAERLTGEFDAGFGIDMIRLGAAEVSALDPLQAGAFDGQGGSGDLIRLHDRMANRLGETAVLRTTAVGSHMPERAARLEPVIQPPAPPAVGTVADRKRPLRLLPNPEPIRVTAEVPEGPPADMTWRRVTYRFVKAAGPERLGEEWWLDHAPLTIDPPPGKDEEKPRTKKSRYGWDEEDEPPLPRRSMLFRDYYTAEDDGGRRFWLFHDGLPGTEGAGWYLHGFFS
ncbi:Y-family DNA polymerase [Paradevosia shaoguanensis]|uniref:DNA polymerase Y family protein n=1 Tax=Paradevosia shaoguanensis TaxID=1335043 RepID=A0AA41QNW1_9HYPH|nr:DNA polymerase Y family protein [Paradevosia shaoguanensis]MCF1743798.1 DNA polymerase Y family protein [Paradevosia shaoguanensis]MCI0128281.1 DNA polymerase Y family protein [Paradevosia shaoguanensis]